MKRTFSARRWLELAISVSIIGISVTLASAQNCKKLTPAGPGLDDAAIINDCFQRKGFAKLKDGTFLLYTPIVFPRSRPEAPVSGVRLLGRGTAVTKLVVQSECANHFPFAEGTQNPGQYEAPIQVIKSPSAELGGFELDVTNLRESCGYQSTYMVLVKSSSATRVSDIRIKGSPYGTPQYTSGGANGGGILVVNSDATTVLNNEIQDVGFTFEVGGTSAGYAGIAIFNSADSAVQNNRIEHSAFGINIVNGQPALGYTGNSSGTTVTGNRIVGAAKVNCPTCSQGRGIKMEACGDGTELPLERLTVSNNEVLDFGGHHTTVSGSGIDLVCGVQKSLFENNRVVGAETAEFALQIRSSYFEKLPNPSHHNTFRFNTFISGRGAPACGDRCVDVNFTHDGPDQIGIQRNGDNKFSSNRLTSMFHETDRDCTDYSHAFFLYLDGREFVRHGESLLLTALGVRPNSQVTFRFRRATDGVEVATHRSLSVNRNCIMNQEYFVFDSGRFPPGSYKVFADYKDGNSDAEIKVDEIGTVKVKPIKGN